MRSLLLPLLLSCPALAASDQPNILFVFTDDHAPHAIGAYGGWLESVDTTPNLDRLAGEGMLFRQSFCTNSICGPSRAVILTGKHSHRNGFMNNGNKFDGNQQTFPKLLQTAGYRTAMIGKWHLKSDPQGFDHWDVLPGQGDYYNPVLISAEGKRQVEGYCTDIVTDLAIDWMEENAGGDQPFLLMCQHKAPHRTWMPAERHLDLYDDVLLPEAPTLFHDSSGRAAPARFEELSIDQDMNLVYDLFLEPFEGWDPKAGFANDGSGFRNLEKMTPAQRSAWDAAFAEENAAFHAANLEGEDLVRWKYQRYLKNYLRCIRGVDDSVGRLLAHLEEKDLADNTVVVYSSDQGFYLGDHGWYDKRWMYEPSLRMPLIVRWPGVTKPGSESEAMVQNLDYAETFLEMAGVEVPGDMQGRSMVPLLQGESPGDWRREIYYHYYEFPSIHRVARHYGIRGERFKLIHYYQFDEWELFDLLLDPDERRNVIADPGYAEVAEWMGQRLENLRAGYGDKSDVAVMPAEWQAPFRAGR